MARIEKWLEKVEAKAGQDEEKGNDEEEEETEDEEEGKKGAKKGDGNGKGRKQNGGKENGGEEDEEEEEVPSFCLVARANAFLRRAIREAIEEKWPGLVTETRGGQVSQSASGCTRGIGLDGMEELRSNRLDDDDVAAGGDEADGRGEGRAAQGAACGEGRQAQRHRRAPTRRQGRLHSHLDWLIRAVSRGLHVTQLYLGIVQG